MRLALAFLIFSAMPAAAQIAPCGQRAQIVAGLSAKFEEARLGYGLHGQGWVLEIFTSPSGSWTALRTLSGGLSCILASGEAWTPEAAAAAIEGDPS